MKVTYQYIKNNTDDSQSNQGNPIRNPDHSVQGNGWSINCNALVHNLPDNE